MQIRITRDVDEFVGLTREFLAASIERNVLATVSEAIQRSGPMPGFDGPWYAAGSDPDSGEVVAAAMRTPPRHMIACGFGDPAAGRELLRAALEVDPALNGVSATPAEADTLCEAWMQLTGGRIERRFSEAMFELEAVTRPGDPPTGQLRKARVADLDLVVAWFRDFSLESGFGEPDSAALSAERLLSNGRLFVWDDGGPMMVIGHASRVAGVSRVGPVYTPSANRGRGYASAAVAELSQRLLDDGAQRCMLFTDLANPTSNKIYMAVGYRRIGDWEEQGFLRPDTAPARTRPEDG